MLYPIKQPKRLSKPDSKIQKVIIKMIEQTFLTHEEIQRLTGRKRYQSQFIALARAGIPATPDADGKPVVCRKIYETLHLGNKPRTTVNKPNLDAI